MGKKTSMKKKRLRKYGLRLVAKCPFMEKQYSS
jgi:hypothetical protein